MDGEVKEHVELRQNDATQLCAECVNLRVSPQQPPLQKKYDSNYDGGVGHSDGGGDDDECLVSMEEAVLTTVMILLLVDGGG